MGGLTDTIDFDVSDVPPDGDDGDEVTHRPITSILDAPDYAEFVRQPKSTKARQYEKKVASMAKSGMQFSITVNRLDDAAAFIHYGPSFASAAGDYAASNEAAAKMIDMICSPSSPALAFVLAAMPMVGQLMRNHEMELSQLPEKRKTMRQRKAERKATAQEAPAAVQFRIPIVGKTISMRLKLRTRLLGGFLSGFRKGTTDPDSLTMKVFSDPKVQVALRKQGYDIRTTAGE